MAVDYVVDMQCKVMDSLSVNGLVSLIKQRDRALAILGMMKRNGMSEQDALNSTFNVQVVTPDGVETKEQKVSDLLEATKQLDELKAYCKSCPASMGRPYGCYGSINYPITRKAEEWIVEISRDAVKNGPPGSLPLMFILDQKLDGGSIKKMRVVPDGNFLELKKPLGITVSGGLFKKKIVNTDQVLSLLLDMGRMKIPHMKMLLYFSGGLKVQDEKPEHGSCQLAIKMTDDKGKESWMTYNLPDKDTDDRTIQGFKNYFRTMFIAYALDKDLITSI